MGCSFYHKDKKVKNAKTLNEQVFVCYNTSDFSDKID